ncbi:MerR family transcriptional regulator [Sneathiella aquimaris]|jgi:DNA-binding transcriptional MerR regulator|uniref:MerR family transcriptional regulator n=1 Tax=Sneathiella aquimaris TaxID=2599305 RepID=UPI00146C2424|nr:helix-turn-helix domain-containing protein [Sneathiella aquimaris]
MYSIGELSRHTGVKIPTIRYYEQMGLIETPERSEGNQRRYHKYGIDRLSFIKHSRDLGLSISDIKELVELSNSPEKSCVEANKIANNHLAAIRTRIKQLKGLEKELSRIATKCSGNNVGKCYVIESLSKHNLCESDHLD